MAPDRILEAVDKAGNGQHGARIRLGEAEVHHYNRMIVSASRQLIFAASPAALNPFRPA